MSMPKRVPWATLAELDELCTWIYSDETDTARKTLARNRLCAWQVNTPLPHALESVLYFLNAILLDSSNAPALARCQVYALAVIRFVNGLVDPLQQGVFARPIYSLAAQIGLPAWIVELRHRSTHEDLPSLEVLREAATQSMQWLLNRYFLPTLSPPSASALENIEIPSLDPLLSEYKSLTKACLRDASLQGRSKADMDRLMRGFLTWIADVSTLYAVDLSIQSSESNVTTQKLKFATQKFCERLCERNGLVPLSKSKRTPSGQPLGHPPNRDIWAPLVQHLDQQNEHFLEELLARMLAIVTDDDAIKSDPTFVTTIASWMLWVVDTSEDQALRAECVKNILGSAGPEGGNSIMRSLVDSLVSQDDALKSSVATLLSATKTKPLATWEPDSLKELETRLEQLKQRLSLKAQSQTSQGSSNRAPMSSDGSEQLPPGWHQIPQSSWVPCPIGAPITM